MLVWLLFFRHNLLGSMKGRLIVCPSLCSPPSQDNFSARPAAVAADVHVAIKLAFLVAAAVAVLALVTCDLCVE